MLVGISMGLAHSTLGNVETVIKILLLPSSTKMCGTGCLKFCGMLLRAGLLLVACPEALPRCYEESAEPHDGCGLQLSYGGTATASIKRI